MTSGKSIKLFLVDGDANGLVTAEIGQWTGKALVVPRASIEKLAKRSEAAKPGIYVLSGPDPEDSDADRVYIGEAENVFSRIRQHLKGKDFWKRVCLFTSSDEHLTKAHIKYLESRLVEIIASAGRVVLDNGNVPPRPSLPESDCADMETYLSQVQVLLPVLGLSITQPVASRRRACRRVAVRAQRRRRDSTSARG
ncbi:MAG: GIY-YIG nuclease family protein [Phycisphaerales bacterium]